MALPAKIAVAAVVAGVGSLTGCYCGGVFDDTPWVSLKKENGSYSGKVGEKYSIYLLAVHGTNDFNEAKWKELHKKYLVDLEDVTVKTQMSTEFGENKVDKKTAYAKHGSTAASSGPEKLNLVCKSIYDKAASSEIDFSDSSSPENKHKLAKDLLKYCSPIREKPITLDKAKSSVYGTGTIGNTEGNKNLLVDPYHEKNYYFWLAQEEWFLSESDSKTNGYFKHFFAGDESNKVLTKRLKDICHDAYGRVKSDTPDKDKPKEDDIKKYCSFGVSVG